MSTLSQFAGGGQRPPKALVNAFSVAGFGVSRVDLNTFNANAKQVLSGAMTAATLKTILSVTGSGSIDFLSARGMDATARTMRMKITIDGVVVFDYTSASIASATVNGAVFIGSGDGTGSVWSAGIEPTLFNTSLLVEVASSLTETDKFTIGYKYRTF